MFLCHLNPRRAQKCLITGLELLSSLCSKDFSKSDQQNKEDFVDKKANTLPPEGVIENSSNRKDFPSYGESKSSNEFFLKLKSYILFEFIGASLKRISTLFPSKYLGAAVSTIEKFVYSHADTFEDALSFFVGCTHSAGTIFPLIHQKIYN